MPTVLSGAPTYTVREPAGSTTYQQGERVRDDHLELVSKEDRKLFTEAPASATDASSEPEAQPKAKRSSTQTPS